MGQTPNVPVRFAFTVGRAIIEDDAIMEVGAVGLGWWAAVNALACEHDGLFRERIAKIRLSALGDVTEGIRMLLAANLLAVVDDQPGWLEVVGWEKWQRFPKTNAERQAAWRERQRNGPVTGRNGRNDKKPTSTTTTTTTPHEHDGPHDDCTKEGRHVHIL